MQDARSELGPAGTGGAVDDAKVVVARGRRRVSRPTTSTSLAPLRAANVVKSFPDPDGGRVQVLSDITLDVARGEFVALVGPSGSGKSTLLYALSGLLPVDRGSVQLSGEDITGMRPAHLARHRRDHVGFVFQSYNLIPSLTASENVALPATLAGHRLDPAQVERALDDVGMLDHAGRRPRELSGGQQQRVAVARVLAVQPDLVFADEPTGALDTASGRQVLSLLRQAASEGAAVLMVTHDLEAAARADRVIVLRDGTVRQELFHPEPAQVLAALQESLQEPPSESPRQVQP